MDECINKMWCIPVMEHYSAIQESKEPTRATTWLSLKNIVSGRSQKRKTTYCVAPFICHELLQIKKIIRKFHPLEVDVIFSA